MLKFLLPAGEAKSEASLIRTLTQYGLNATKFCTDFNQKSLEVFPRGLLITAKLKINFETKTYELKLDNFSLRFAAQALNDIEVTTMYDLYRVTYLNNMRHFNYLNMSTFFGTLGTFGRIQQLKIMKKE